MIGLITVVTRRIFGVGERLRPICYEQVAGSIGDINRYDLLGQLGRCGVEPQTRLAERESIKDGELQVNSVSR